ncbi:putative equilibrative nucleoside transporter, major facilitator superfamily [Rosa chinensis]|uniref:Putative equilibrative nucleoside transporter, major facilitator superfamily n=1 Tax=Rosa chinensis TaxID=74649 RepID=A0A2P6R411_ROSCH|nr:equilibrative nucleotide transporter 1 [Rosa chinensis]PRQ41166.1 putative equilibrative nucleoside transporter, major facilitator superfamily [Rosa chinensis]
MGLAAKTPEENSESSLLLPTTTPTPDGAAAPNKVPNDPFHLTYIIYFTLGLGYLLPWNAFITAVDYFTYLYPDASVDRIFSVAYMLVGLVVLLIIVFYAQKSDAYVRINVGLALFVVSLLIVPVLDLVYIQGRVGLYAGFYVTVAAVALSGLADALVQGSLIGAAGELPEKYMQAIVAGTAGSGVLVSFLRILTKAVYPQTGEGLRKSANLYFAVGIVVMVICIVFYNVAPRIPVMKYYAELKIQTINEEKELKGPLTGSVLRSTLWGVVGSVKWYGIGILLIYIVTLAIFPGYITEDVHSELLKDWYAVILITGYNVFDLVGKALTSVYLLENSKVAIGGTVARLLFFPLFYGCLHGPAFFRTEIPVTILTCLLGLTNGYLTSVLMILAPKVVQLQHAETAGIVIVLFLVVGLAAGSLVSWFWVI